jgi:hypothetical protein
MFDSSVMSKKRCSKCKQIRPTTEYAPDKRNSDGFQSQCRVCKRIADSNYGRRKTAKKQQVRIQERALLPPKRCAVDGCDGKMHGDVWCAKHYQRVLNHGDPLYGELPRYDKCAVGGVRQERQEWILPVLRSSLLPH